MAGVPFVVNEEPFNNPRTLLRLITLPQVFPSGGRRRSGLRLLPSAVNPNLQMPYSMQYSLTVEHSRWDTGFRALLYRDEYPAGRSIVKLQLARA